MFFWFKKKAKKEPQKCGLIEETLQKYESISIPLRRAQPQAATDAFDELLSALRKNQISLTPCKARQNGAPQRSKFGGKPAVPVGFEWPHFTAANFDGETADRPLAFLCQINLAELGNYDTENMLPKTGVLLFFYELESMRWGYAPTDSGCARVYYFEDTNALIAADFPDGLREEYRIGEYDLSFTAEDSYPYYEECAFHTDMAIDWDAWEEYEEAVEAAGYELVGGRHKLLGYADVIQNEMLTECESTARGMYCGNPESYQELSGSTKEDINKAAADWTLLFQMESIEEDGCELMFGDFGNIYFYIRKQDLKEHDFSKVWLVLQCG